jgi:hypothetical protein
LEVSKASTPDRSDIVQDSRLIEPMSCLAKLVFAIAYGALGRQAKLPTKASGPRPI